MPGYVKKVKGTKNRFRITVEAGKDPVTGNRKRIVRYHTGRESDAKDIMAMLIAELEQGTHVDPSKLTMAEWMDTWLQDYKKNNLRASTYELYIWTTDHFIKPAIGSIHVQKLQTEHLQRLYNSLVEEKKSSRTVHQVHQLISAALKQAIKTHKIKHNPADATTLPQLKYGKIKYLDTDEQQIFINALDDHPHGAAFITLFGTGTRRSELLGLHWEDADQAVDAYVEQLEKEKELEALGAKAKKRVKDLVLQEKIEFVKGTIEQLKKERVIYIHCGIVAVKGQGLNEDDTKTEKGNRTIPIPKMVAEYLYRHRETLKEKGLYKPDGPVFPSKNGKHMWPRNFNRIFEKLRDKLGLKNITPHGLRHTFATNLLEIGEDMRTIQELLGHAKESTSADIYAHVTEKLKRQAVNKLDDIMIPGTKEIKKEVPRVPNGHQKTLRRIK